MNLLPSEGTPISVLISYMGVLPFPSGANAPEFSLYEQEVHSLAIGIVSDELPFTSHEEKVCFSLDMISPQTQQIFSCVEGFETYSVLSCEQAVEIHAETVALFPSLEGERAEESVLSLIKEAVSAQF